MTTDSRARFAPLLIAETVPVPGEVKRTPGPLLVFEEKLPQHYAVSLPDRHGRTEADEVGTDNRHPGGGSGFFDYLLAVPCYRKIKPVPDRKGPPHPHIPVSFVEWNVRMILQRK